MSKRNWYAGINNFLKDKNRRLISIVSADQNLANEVALVLTAYMKEKGVDIRYVDREFSMLSKGIRVLKTQKGITIYKTSRVLLEATRELQNYAEATREASDGCTILQSYSSSYMAMETLANESFMRRKLLKWIVRRGVYMPDTMFILQSDKKKLFESKKKFDQVHKVEDSQKGASFSIRDKKDAEIADFLTSRGVNVFRIDARTATKEQVATMMLGIIEKIEEAKNEPKEDRPSQS